jgi:hypothetical protein
MELNFFLDEIQESRTHGMRVHVMYTSQHSTSRPQKEGRHRESVRPDSVFSALPPPSKRQDFGGCRRHASYN